MNTKEALQNAIERLAEGGPIQLPPQNIIDFYPYGSANPNREFPIAVLNQDPSKERMFDEHTFELNKITHHQLAMPHESVDWVTQSMQEKFTDACRLLTAAGIPVFYESTTPKIEHGPRGEVIVTSEIQVPSQLVYKYFFVVYDFDEAVNQSCQYIRQKVQEVISKY